jgi:hypothetical protein
MVWRNQSRKYVAQGEIRKKRQRANTRMGSVEPKEVGRKTGEEQSEESM